MRKSVHITMAAMMLLLVSAASYAVADNGRPATRTRTVTTASVAVISACKNNKTHALYLEPRCPRGYSRVTWNTKGPQGPKGATGPAGATGAAGAPGKNGTDGANGTNGTNGTAATVAVGTVSTGAAGSNASVTNTGTSSAAKLNFTIPQGAAGADGTDGAAGTAPWSTPQALSSTGSNSVRACPYVASTSTTTGTPATAITWDGGTYEYVGASCAVVLAGSGDPTSSPSDWTEIAAAGLNGEANAWAVIDPGTCASGGSCVGDVMKQGGVVGEGVSFTYESPGLYDLTVTGCTPSDTPSAGSRFPAAISVTPDVTITGESSNDAHYAASWGNASSPTSDGVIGGLGVINFYVSVFTTGGSTEGSSNQIDEPFSVTVNC